MGSGGGGGGFSLKKFITTGDGSVNSAGSPGGPQTNTGENAAREDARKNILADQRLSDADRATLIDALNKPPDQFNALYASMTADPNKLADKKNSENLGKQVADTPGLNRQTLLGGSAPGLPGGYSPANADNKKRILLGR